jgi:hypothetical protein
MKGGAGREKKEKKKEKYSSFKSTAVVLVDKFDIIPAANITQLKFHLSKHICASTTDNCFFSMKKLMVILRLISH